MEETVDAKSVYELQDRVLEIMRNIESSFYLTGGTALHRFYYHLRCSEDLDFFTEPQDPLFPEYIREILDQFGFRGYAYSPVVQSKNFHRIRFQGHLQVDFVQDASFRFGKSNLIDGNKIDNPMNILANKVTAIVDRDEEKDVFDLFAIATHQSFEWAEVLEIANRKATLNRDVLIERLMSFPLSWLERIKSTRPFFVTEDMVRMVCQDILENRRNTLAGNTGGRF